MSVGTTFWYGYAGYTLKFRITSTSPPEVYYHNDSAYNYEVNGTINFVGSLPFYSSSPFNRNPQGQICFNSEYQLIRPYTLELASQVVYNNVTYDVVGIDASTFKNIVIILWGNYAYNTNLWGFTSVILPSKLRFMGTHAFTSNTQLSGQIVYPNTFSSFSYYMFNTTSISSSKFLGNKPSKANVGNLGYNYDTADLFGSKIYGAGANGWVNGENWNGYLVETFKLDTVIQPWSLSNKTFDTTPFTLTPPTSNSNAPFIYSIFTGGNIASVNSGTGVLTMVGTGNVVIKVHQDSNSDYNSSTDVYGSFTISKGIPNVTLKDGNNNTINPTNNVYTVAYNKNKIPRMDKLTLISNNNETVVSSVVQTGSSLVQYSSNGNIRLVNHGTVTIKVSQDETSNYLASEKTITIKLVKSAIQGRRPVFLRNL